MATNSNSFIRLRLFFDYPPPSVTDCRMCWLLVDLNRCRVVADLESIIREKFEFSPRSILDLFIEDCYLPHTESIFVIRDNDSVRVKVDSEAQVNGHSSCLDTPGKNCKKRQRPTEEEEEGPGGDGASVEWKEKKRKKQSKEKPEEVAKVTTCDERNKKSEEKQTKKTKKKKKKAEEPPTPAVPAKKTTTVVNKPVQIIKKASAAKSQPASSSDSSSSEEDVAPKKPPAKKPTTIVHKPVESIKKASAAKSQPASSSDSSSSSEGDVAPKKPPAKKPTPKTPASTPAASKAAPKAKPTQKPSRPASSSSSSSSETDSSSDEAPAVKNTQKSKLSTSTTPKTPIGANSSSQQAPPTNCGSNEKPAELRDSDGDEIGLIIRKPQQQQSGYGLGRQPPWRGGGGRGAQRGGGGGPRERGRGGGRGSVRWQAGGSEFSSNGAKEPSYQTDSLTNTSLVIQNGAESAPKKDYSTLPLLAAPPQLGQKIAFKLLELGENYTPEVSDYKEGKIVSFDPTTKQIELELLHVSQAPVEPGKFDLVYLNPDGSERVEYAVSRGAWVAERWDSLLEPRLLI